MGFSVYAEFRLIHIHAQIIALPRGAKVMLESLSAANNTICNIF